MGYSTQRVRTKWFVFVTVCFALVAVLLLTSTFSLQSIIQQQQPWPFVVILPFAFLTFFIAVLFYIAAILRISSYPNRYACVFGVFILLLAAYLVLLFFGPSIELERDMIIQATGQKIIVYAAIVAAFILAGGARRMIEADAARRDLPTAG